MYITCKIVRLIFNFKLKQTVISRHCYTFELDAIIPPQYYNIYPSIINYKTYQLIHIVLILEFRDRGNIINLLHIYLEYTISHLRIDDTVLAFILMDVMYFNKLFSLFT